MKKAFVLILGLVVSIFIISIIPPLKSSSQKYKIDVKESNSIESWRNINFIKNRIKNESIELKKKSEGKDSILNRLKFQNQVLNNKNSLLKREIIDLKEHIIDTVFLDIVREY